MPATSTFEEQTLMSLYNASGTRQGLVESLEEMRGFLEPDETELCQLTDSALEKLRAMSDADYAALDLEPNL